MIGQSPERTKEQKMQITNQNHSAGNQNLSFKRVIMNHDSLANSRFAPVRVALSKEEIKTGLDEISGGLKYELVGVQDPKPEKDTLEIRINGERDYSEPVSVEFNAADFEPQKILDAAQQAKDILNINKEQMPKLKKLYPGW